MVWSVYNLLNQEHQLEFQPDNFHTALYENTDVMLLMACKKEIYIKMFSKLKHGNVKIVQFTFCACLVPLVQQVINSPYP